MHPSPLTWKSCAGRAACSRVAMLTSTVTVHNGQSRRAARAVCKHGPRCCHDGLCRCRLCRDGRGGGVHLHSIVHHSKQWTETLAAAKLLLVMHQVGARQNSLKALEPKRSALCASAVVKLWLLQAWVVLWGSSWRVARPSCCSRPSTSSGSTTLSAAASTSRPPSSSRFPPAPISRPRAFPLRMAAVPHLECDHHRWRLQTSTHPPQCPILYVPAQVAEQLLDDGTWQSLRRHSLCAAAPRWPRAPS